MQFLRWSSGLLLVILILWVPVLGAQTLNFSFNTPNGYALWHTANASQDRNLNMAIQSDGKILVSGFTNISGQHDIRICRYFPDGTPDISFGRSGQVLFSGGTDKDDYALGITLDASENILVAGREYNGKDSNLILIRCKPDGTPDTTFGENGTVVHSTGGLGTDLRPDITIQQDGKIVLCGEVNSSHKEMAVFRYNTNGTPDQSFATNGMVSLGNLNGSESNAYAITLDPEKRIIVTGTIEVNGTRQVGLVQLLDNGTLDQSFGTGGVVTWNGSESGPDYGNQVYITQEGKILVTGVETDSSGFFDIVLLKYNRDGSLDSEFGDNGVARFGRSGPDYAWSQATLPDESIIVAGTTLVNGYGCPALIKWTPDGVLDSSFGTNGLLTYETIGYGQFHAVDTDEQGNLFAAGYITENGIDLGLLIQENSD